MDKLLYIGAGLHVNPLQHFMDTKEFIFVDTRPRSEFDDCYPSDTFVPAFYEKNFYLNLVNSLEQINFILENTEELEPDYHNRFIHIMNIYKNKSRRFPDNSNSNIKIRFPFICPTLLEFVNHTTGQRLKYYISTNIIFHTPPKLELDMMPSTGLIISGYHPNKVLFNYITKPINLFCYTKTCYNVRDDEIDDYDNIMHLIFTDKSKAPIYFSNIYSVDNDTGIYELWNDFLNQ